MSFLPKNLVFLRKKFGITQSQLALRLNKGQTTIGGWENNASEPAIDLLVEISDIFGVSIDYLVKVDLEKGNLITEMHVKEFKQNSKGIGNPIGKLIAKFDPIPVENSGQKMDPTGQDLIKDWTVIKILKGIDEKIDEIRVSLGNKPENG
jgi:transcriptional regulator with XRE-family HTH domain